MKRKAATLTFEGFTLTYREWVKKLEEEKGIKLSIGCILTRVSYNWPVKKILTTPARKAWPMQAEVKRVSEKDKLEPI